MGEAVSSWRPALLQQGLRVLESWTGVLGCGPKGWSEPLRLMSALRALAVGSVILQ